MNAAEAQELATLSQRVCESVVAYAGAQLSDSLECMQVMEQVLMGINRKYSSMRAELKAVGKLSKVVKAKARQMEDKMDCIDDIDEELTELEDMVDQLEQYTASLQTKFNEVSA